MKTKNYQNKISNDWNNINQKKAELNLAYLQYEILKAHCKGDDNLIVLILIIL